MPTAVEDKTDPWTQALGSSAQYSSADSILPDQLSSSYQVTRSRGRDLIGQMSHVVVAPDKFKGTLTAAQVAAHVAAGLDRPRTSMD